MIKQYVLLEISILFDILVFIMIIWNVVLFFLMCS